ncbi:MAG: hypothetical protein PHW74_14205 [Desulfobacca sp.]|nr:hypothetical protein [Desulfobacca sp.]
MEVYHSGDDSVGQRLVYRIKEEIRQSSSLRLTKSDEPRILVSIVTLEKDELYPGRSTIYSMVIRAEIDEEYYLNQFVGFCGVKRIKDVAEEIIAEIDKLEKAFDNLKYIDKLRKQLEETTDKAFWKHLEIIETEMAKTKDLEAALEKERAKTWWDKLLESLSIGKQ